MSWTAPPLEPLVGPSGSDPVWDEVKVFDGCPMYIGRDGQPMTLRQWATGMENIEYRVLGKTTVSGVEMGFGKSTDGDIEVITAWLGIDSDAGMTLGLRERPLIYGTIMHRSGVFSDEVLSATEEEARAEHNRRVSELQEKATKP